MVKRDGLFPVLPELFLQTAHDVLDMLGNCSILILLRNIRQLSWLQLLSDNLSTKNRPIFVKNVEFCN